jgi:hypothetical protein
MLNLALHNANHWAQRLMGFVRQSFATTHLTLSSLDAAVRSAFQHVALVPNPRDRTVRSLLKKDCTVSALW